ncbi:MAG: fibrobacter succinogenes major paralogous domain-containing protein [Paludibacter sp.]|nr:fibrobacter succinogenes major paralogous domain-containing protein [Paludibacter sp.]
MKKLIFALFGIMVTMSLLNAQTDSMYVMKSGVAVGKFKVTEVDSVVFYKPATSSNTVTDVDGNVYHTIVIGAQTWMVENLKTTKYNDNSSISIVTDNAIWMGLTTGAYCWYNNDITNKTPYGAMYNWYAVNSGKLSPKGWHVPTDVELATLVTYLGGTTVAGGKLKETGTTHWTSNTSATNESGFSAVGAGYRLDTSGSFGGLQTYMTFWSSVAFDASNSYSSTLKASDGTIGTVPSPNKFGKTVRCIKD